MYNGAGKRQGPRVVPMATWLGIGLIAMGAATCRHGAILNMDEKFSVNLARPGDGWPDLKKMSPAQIAAYEKHGRPDFFRIWYNARGEIATSREAGPVVRAGGVGKQRRSWLYEQKKMEIVFRSETSFDELPLSDPIQVLCLRGDPQARDVQSLKEGMIRETWTYYDVGEVYIFVDGRLAKKQILKGIGRPFQRL